MFGGEVDKGPSHPGNLCTAAYIAEGDTCGIGTVGAGDGQIERLSYPGNYIAVGPAGTVFLGDDKGRIQEFEPSGAFKSKFTLAGELPGNTISSLAVDGAGNFYVKFLAKDNVYKFGPTGTLLSTIATELSGESPLVLDAAGGLYAIHENHPVLSEDAVNPRSHRVQPDWRPDRSCRARLRGAGSTARRGRRLVGGPS